MTEKLFTFIESFCKKFPQAVITPMEVIMSWGASHNARFLNAFEMHLKHNLGGKSMYEIIN